MAGQKEVSVGVKFTGDAAGFQKAVYDVQGALKGVSSNIGNLKTLLGATGLNQALELGKKVWEGYKTVMESTEGTAETLEQQIGFLKGAMQGLLTTIVTGEWDLLLTNMRNIAEATRDMKNALQEYDHSLAGASIRKGLISLGLQEARVSAAEENDPVKKAGYLQTAIDLQRELTSIEVSEIQKRLNITEDYYYKVTGHSKEYFEMFLKYLPRIAQNYDYYFGENSAAIEGINSRIESLKRLDLLRGLTGIEQKELDDLTALNAILKDYISIKDDFSKKGQFDEYLRGIGEMAYASAAGEKALVRLVKQLDTVQNKINPSKSEIGASQVLPYPILGGAIPQSPGLRGTNTSTYIDRSTEALNQQLQVVNGLQSAFVNMFYSIDNGFQGMANSMIESLKRLVSELLAKAAVFAVLKALFPEIFIGLDLTSRAGRNKYFFGLAEGGIVSGPTMAMVGEYAGAKSNPEVVAPLSKLKNMMGSKDVLLTKVSGRDLDIILQRYYSIKNANT